MADFSPEGLRPFVEQLYQQETQVSPASAGPSDGQRRFRRIGLPALIGSHALDGISTAFATPNPAIYEADPITRRLFGTEPSAGTSIGWQAGQAALESYLLDKLSKSHPKLALLGALAVSGAHTKAGLNNIHLIRKHKDDR